MANDYERLIEKIDGAVQGTETAYYDAVDPDIETLLDEALDQIREARALAEERV